VKVLFAGTPEIAVPSLEALADAGLVAGVLSNPDRPQGRGRKLTPSPVKAAAQNRGLPVWTPEKLDASFREEIASLGADLLVVFAYGKIFRESFISLFPQGGINVHPSKLPQFRGPSPLSETILAGLDHLTLTIQTLALKMDAGDILYQKDFPLQGRENTGDLTQMAAALAGPALVEVLGDWEKHCARARKQEEDQATYCHLISKEEGLIDWSRSAVEIDRLIRAYFPWPKGQTFFQGTPLSILKAKPLEGDSDQPPGKVINLDKGHGILVQTGDGLLALQELQLKGKKALDFKSFLNGTKDFIHTTLGS